MVAIDQLARFTSVRAAAIVFEPLKFHLQLLDLLEQLCLLDLALAGILYVFPQVNSSLAPSRSCSIFWLTRIGRIG